MRHLRKLIKTPNGYQWVSAAPSALEHQDAPMDPGELASENINASAVNFCKS